MVNFSVIEEVENYLERPVLVQKPNYWEVVDPADDELLATLEEGPNYFELRVDGEYKITIPKGGFSDR